MSYRNVRDVLVNRKPFVVEPGSTVRAACQAMAASGIGSVLVCQNRRLIGIFTERDALCRVLAAGRDPDTTPVAQVMSLSPVTIDPDRPVTEALHQMLECGFRHLPVVENGYAVGVISMRDAMDGDLAPVARDGNHKDVFREILA